MSVMLYCMFSVGKKLS